ncbi:MAG: zf-HC2 domain-containing protein [Syntrophomonas sp.]
MRCKKVRLLISPYLDEMTDRSETRLVEEHLAVCPVCLQYANKVRGIRQVMLHLDCPLPPPNLVSDVCRRLREEHFREQSRPGVGRRLRVLAGKAWGSRLKNEAIRFYRWRKKPLE